MKISIIIGTRPEVIKMAPVILELKTRGHEVKLITTGQHTNLLDMSLLDFDLKADNKIELNSKTNSFAEIASVILPRITTLSTNNKINLVLVHGDTNSAAIGALAGFHLGIPVGHVEAGLRTISLSEPFPEEGNRRVVDAVSTLKFAPTKKPYERLVSESNSTDGIFLTGNTVVDALEMLKINGKLQEAEFSLQMKYPKIFDSPYILLTQHRRESFGESMSNVFKAISEIANENNVNIVFPVHPNPAVKAQAEKIFKGDERIHLIDPMPYPQMIAAIKRSEFVITDSGGIQEEAPYLDKFVLITRNITERPEAVESGNAQIVGLDAKQIKKSSVSQLGEPRNFLTSRSINPFGAPGASSRIAFHIEQSFMSDVP